jgi:hypothetical protein
VKSAWLGKYRQENKLIGDADQTEFGASLLLRSSAHRVPYVNFMFLVVKPPLFPCFSSIRVLRVFISLLY